MNSDAFIVLLHRAIGDQSQVDFADRAGLSRFTLNHYLHHTVSAAPRRTTLAMIAEASEGRVALSELLSACGMPVTEDDRESEEAFFRRYQRKAGDAAEKIRTTSKVSGKYIGLDEWAEQITLSDKASITFGAAEEVRNPESAENTAPLYVTWYDFEEGKKVVLTGIIGFCHTRGTKHSLSGIVVLNTVFDPETVLEYGYSHAVLQMKDGTDLKDVPFCLTIEEMKE